MQDFVDRGETLGLSSPLSMWVLLKSLSKGRYYFDPYIIQKAPWVAICVMGWIEQE